MINETTYVTPDDIVSEFEHLRNWLEDAGGHIAEYHQDELHLHLYVTTIYQPSWMRNTYQYTLCIDGQTVEGDWQTMLTSLVFMKPLELITESICQNELITRVY